MPQADPKSSSGQKQQQTAQTVPNPPFPDPQVLEYDSIDLYELSISLWNKKWLVIAFTVVAALGSIIYALQLKHVYKAEALLLPPNPKDIQSINVLEGFLKTHIGSPRITSKNIFDTYKQNLNSRTLHKKFVLENGLMEILSPDRAPNIRDEDVYKEFTKLINLEDQEGGTSISIELNDGEIAAQWVNDLIEFVDKETIVSLLEDLRNSIANQIREIDYTIESKRQMAKRRRLDQIIRYGEAAKIADSLGIKRRVDATNIIQNTQMNVDIATATTPLYYLGFEALSTEISVLRNRKSDDPFISGLRDLQERLTLLRSIKFEKEKMRAVHIDQAAYPPNSPIKPNRRNIVSLATLVGLFSGILLAFFIEFVKIQRRKHSE